MSSRIDYSTKEKQQMIDEIYKPEPFKDRVTAAFGLIASICVIILLSALF